MNFFLSQQLKGNSLVMDTLKNLHEGNVARYKLKLSEFQKWKQSGDKK